MKTTGSLSPLALSRQLFAALERCPNHLFDPVPQHQYLRDHGCHWPFEPGALAFPRRGLSSQMAQLEHRVAPLGREGIPGLYPVYFK